MSGVVVSDPAYSVENRNTDVCTECFTAFKDGLPNGYNALAITTNSDRVTEAEDEQAAIYAVQDLNLNVVDGVT